MFHRVSGCRCASISLLVVLLAARAVAQAQLVDVCPASGPCSDNDLAITFVPQNSNVFEFDDFAVGMTIPS